MAYVPFVEPFAKNRSDAFDVAIPDGEESATEAIGSEELSPKLDGFQ